MRLRILLILIALCLFCTTWAVAQDDAGKAETEKKASESESQESVTYTKDHLRDQVDESAKSPAVIYNESLEKKTAEKKDESPAVVFTNETLTERFGEAPPASRPTSPTADTPAGDDADSEPDAETEAETGMSAEERAKRIAEIEAQIERLKKRTLAIKNPYLAGTTPATDKERENEQGMANPERLEGVEKQIAELEAELQELQSGN